jgi:hypothetical protein
MLDIIKQNKVILIVLVVIIVGFAWFGLADQQPTTSLLANESRGDNSVAEQEILRLLLDMRSIRLDSSIFENPAFGSLRDFGRDIVPEPVGRTNPFAPTKNFFELTAEDEAADAVFAE